MASLKKRSAPSVLNSLNEPEIQLRSYKPTRTTCINHAWIIDNFSSQLSPIKSPDFWTKTKGTKYTLILSMHDINDPDDNGYYSITIQFLEGTRPPIVMEYKFSIVNRDAVRAKILYDELKYDGNPIVPVTFITRRDLIASADELLPNDRLTVLCEMSVTEECPLRVSQIPRTIMTIPESILKDNLRDLFANKILCDVEFIVGPDGEKIEAHKALLSVRSTVFRATFGNDMEESKNNQVVVGNFSPDVFNKMLEFVYTDQVENFDDRTPDLLIIANYYNLKRLRMMCEKFLYQKLTVENAAETLILADLHNANTLKLHARNFIKKYAVEFTKTVGFQSMKKENSELAIEILTMLTDNSMICPVLSGMDNLLLNAELSDVTLVVGVEELSAHQVILANQSPVFAEAFKTLKTPNRLVIKNVQGVIMREVLAFLYTGHLGEEHDVDILLQVLAVAEIYQIIKLKALCADKLEKKVTVDTAVPILIKADDYRAPELSKKALDFIQLNTTEILSLENFKQLCSKKPELLFKLWSLAVKK